MGRSPINLVGQKFGRLTVIERNTTRPMGAGKSAYWKCLCDCGNYTTVRTDKLRNGDISSCGCYSKEVRTKLFLKDLTNQTFGRLTVIERDTTKPMGKENFAYWKCKCQCGNIVSVRGDHLRHHTTQSCGCLNSAGEELVSSILQQNHIQYSTQYTFNDLKGGYNNLRFDFAIFQDTTLICLIEFQGEQHFSKWGNESQERFEKRQEYDQKKRDYCKINHIPLIELDCTMKNNLSEILLTKLKEVY